MELLLTLMALIQIPPTKAVDYYSRTEGGGHDPLIQEGGHDCGHSSADNETDTYTVQWAKHALSLRPMGASANRAT